MPKFTYYEPVSLPEALSLLKDHDNPNVANLTLALDPATMLLVKK